VVPSGGIWFTGCPWGTDTTAVLAYGGSELVMWSGVAYGCGGSGSIGFGTVAPINGSFCDNLGYTFTVGDCGSTPPPSFLDDITVEKPAEDPS
jgi:hypothetical protein